jgi:hypothetical protein
MVSRINLCIKPENNLKHIIMNNAPQRRESKLIFLSTSISSIIYIVIKGAGRSRSEAMSMISPASIARDVYGFR